MPPLPTSNISGSLNEPGPAYTDKPTYLCKIDTNESHLSSISPVVLHELETLGAHVYTSSSPH